MHFNNPNSKHDIFQLNLPIKQSFEDNKVTKTLLFVELNINHLKLTISGVNYYIMGWPERIIKGTFV